MTVLMHLIKDGVDTPMNLTIDQMDAKRVILSKLPESIDGVTNLKQLLSGVDTTTLASTTYVKDQIAAALKEALNGLSLQMGTDGRLVVSIPEETTETA